MQNINRVMDILNIAIPDADTPHDKKGREYRRESPHDTLIWITESLGDTGDKEGRNENAGGYVPEGHTAHYGVLTFNLQGAV